MGVDLCPKEPVLTKEGSRSQERYTYRKFWNSRTKATLWSLRTHPRPSEASALLEREPGLLQATHRFCC
ncbi:hypothetical protein ACRRTK_019170 [Alexandromys fortis]